MSANAMGDSPYEGQRGTRTRAARALFMSDDEASPPGVAVASASSPEGPGGRRQFYEVNRYVHEHANRWSLLAMINSPRVHPEEVETYEEDLRKVQWALGFAEKKRMHMHERILSDATDNLTRLAAKPGANSTEMGEERTPARWMQMGGAIISRMANLYLQGVPISIEELEQIEGAVRMATYFANRKVDETERFDLSLIQSFQSLLQTIQADTMMQTILAQAELDQSPSKSSVKTPTSMSASRSVSRNYGSDESYHTHSKLREDLTGMPEKSRKLLLRELRQACSVMLDSITYKDFRKMTRRNLRLIIKLGPGKPQSCYNVKNIYKHWASAEKEGKVLKDPLTRNPVTAEEKREIMEKIKRVRPNAVDLLQRDARTRYHPVYKLSVGDPVEVEGHVFYPLAVVLTASSIEFIIKELGYFPAEAPHGDTSADMTSAALLARLSNLVENRAIFDNALPPISCCNIALPVRPKLWLRNGEVRGDVYVNVARQIGFMEVHASMNVL